MTGWRSEREITSDRIVMCRCRPMIQYKNRYKNTFGIDDVREFDAKTLKRLPPRAPPKART